VTGKTLLARQAKGGATVLKVGVQTVQFLTPYNFCLPGGIWNRTLHVFHYDV